MSAHPLRLASTMGGDVRWDWLAPAVRMAAAVHGIHPLAADRAALEWTCYPRVATRTSRGTAQSVGAARDFSLATLRRWTVADRTDDIAIVLSELLTNALRHGTGRPARSGWRWSSPRSTCWSWWPTPGGSCRCSGTRTTWPRAAAGCT